MGRVAEDVDEQMGARLRMADYRCGRSRSTLWSTSSEVGFVSGRSRLYGIIGHPITQVRSPEMVTAEFVKRGHHGIFVPFHVEPHDFEASTRALLRMPNLDGLVFTIPYKQRAMALANRIAGRPAVAARGRAPTALACRLRCDRHARDDAAAGACRSLRMRDGARSGNDARTDYPHRLRSSASRCCQRTAVSVAT